MLLLEASEEAYQWRWTRTIPIHSPTVAACCAEPGGRPTAVFVAARHMEGGEARRLVLLLRRGTPCEFSFSGF